MNEFVVTAVGEDRPGIVAALAGALLEIDGNLADVRAALLRGSFATMLAVSVPRGYDADAVRRALAPIAAGLGLGLHVAPAAPAPAGPARGRVVVSVYGADRPGIVHGVAVQLAEVGGNIRDLSARQVGNPPVYVLGIQLELPHDVDATQLPLKLEAIAAEYGVEIALDDEDDDIL